MEELNVGNGDKVQKRKKIRKRKEFRNGKWEKCK